MTLFADRRQAGRELARRLQEYAGRPDVIVLALPRGGVPVGFEVASALRAPLDVFTVRKLGTPWNPELAIGALASGGIVFLDEAAVGLLGIDPDDIRRTVGSESRELSRREQLYRDERPFPDLRGKTVILVDDGLATGYTMRAAIHAVRTQRPARVIVAAPVASRQACDALGEVADRCVCVADPEPFYGVGMWYDDFSPTSDSEVLELLEAVRDGDRERQYVG